MKKNMLVLERTIKKKSLAIYRILLVDSLLLSILSMSSAVGAEGVNNNEMRSKHRFQIETEVDLEYNDNVFRMTDEEKSRKAENSLADIVSNRFRDMERNYGFIISPCVGLDFETGSGLGGEFSVKPWVKYNFYEENSVKNYPEGGIEFTQSVGKNGRIRLEGNFFNQFYRDNDLSGAKDVNEIGRITRSERVYSPVIYDEYEGIIAYRHRLRESMKGNDKWLQIPGIQIQPFSGARYRRYDDPFGNRDRNVILGGLAFDFDFGLKTDVDLIYSYERVSCPGNEEFVILDETVTGFNADINGDGEFNENAPVITDVDRSRDHHIIEFEITIDFAKNWRGFAGYRLRELSFDSGNPFDEEHYGQDETRQRIRTGIRCDFSKDWTTMLEYRWTHDESYDGIFTQNRIIFSIGYRF